MRNYQKQRRRRARRRLRRWSIRIGGGSLATAGAIALVLGGTVLLQDRSGWAEVTSLLDYARESPVDPLQLIVSAGRSHRIVYLGDVQSASEPKWLAAAAVEGLARGPGLDAVALEVGADQQPHIDAYLESEPEDASILLRHPRTLRDGQGPARAYLEIYRRVWRLNRELGPGRRIRIVAADLAGWPPDRPLPPQVAASRYAERDAFMAERLEAEVLGRSPRARLLIFMSGYHGLKAGEAVLRFGGGEPVTSTWLAARLRQRHPGQVYTILLDGGAHAGTPGPLTVAGATRVFDLFRENLTEITAPFGLRVDGRFDFIQQPLQELRAPGISISVQPEGYRLRDVVDGYVYLGVTSGIRRTP